jgi:signal transduction histidine kinase
MTAPGNLPFPVAAFPASVPSSKHLIAAEDDMRIPLIDAASSDFMARTFAVTAPPKPRLSPVLSLAEGNGVSHRVFETSQHTPGVLRTTGVLPDLQSPEGFSKTFIPVPEPGTFVFLTTAIGGIFGYGLWRCRKHGSAQLTSSPERFSNTFQSCTDNQEERMVIVGTMIAEVIHDVKNALTSIRTCAEVLAYDDLEPTERQEFAQTIVSQVDRTLDMIHDVLECSSDHRETLQLQTVSVEDFLQEVLVAIESDFALRNIATRLDVQYTGTIRVDVTQMKRVFLNLASNARDAMPDGGTFTLSCRSIKEAGARHAGTCPVPVVEFGLTDTGCGMSPELQARLFEPFVTEGKPHGTGLGMAIVKTILDVHQAQIEVRSAVAEGTTIRMLLPVYVNSGVTNIRIRQGVA